ncbi:MAG TPA: hypothetical protein VFU88_14830 [Ktedonobacterales bacterium]|nr:hypothetical protein [Ktedonobacterales bacterium]
MSPPNDARRAGPRPTVRLQDLAYDDRETTYRTPHGSDWLVLALLVSGLLGCGLYTWIRLGPENDHIGRAIFFGALLVSAFWAAIVYTFKLSVSVRVGAHGVSVVRGPWRTELPWRDVGRMVERAQTVDRQRLRWVVLLARDGRRLQIREDMVADYARFRREVFERYTLWRDHGGTLGAAGGGPFTTREMLSGQVTWWAVAAGTLLLPGLYFALVLPETELLGPVLLALAVGCALLSLRARMRRQSLTIDAKALAARRMGRTVRLTWRDVARVDRSRHRFTPLVAAAIAIARLLVKLASRNDGRVIAFDWYPRVPEYLTLRGAGRQIRIALHRLPRPDELLAWVEFYESVGRKTAASREAPRRSVPMEPAASEPSREPAATPAPASASGAAPSVPAQAPMPAPTYPPMPAPTPGPVPTSSYPAGRERVPSHEPADPWAGGGLEFPGMAGAGGLAGVAGAAEWSMEDTGGEEEDAWLRAEPGDEPTGRRHDAVAVQGSGTFEAPQAAGAKPLYPHPQTHEAVRAEPPPPASGESAWSGSTGQLWPPSAPLEERLPAVETDQPAQRGWYQAVPDLGPDDFNWPLAEEPGEDQLPDQPTEAMDAMADLAPSSAPWRDDRDWQPPALPRFGPPVPTEGQPDSPGQGGGNDSGSFDSDEFLR